MSSRTIRKTPGHNSESYNQYGRGKGNFLAVIASSEAVYNRFVKAAFS